MAEPRVLVQDRGAVRRLVLNRPERRNALDHRTIEAVIASLAAADGDDRIRVVILAGAGPGFCAGADLVETGALADEAAIADHAGLIARLLLAPWTSAKPVVSELHGFALGAGLGLAISCDAVFCASDARIGFPEARHGMVPALVAPALLSRAGYAATFELLATAREIPVARAEALGLLRATASGAQESEAARFADAVASAGTEVTGPLKALLRDIAGHEMPAAMEIARRANIAGKLRRLQGGT